MRIALKIAYDGRAFYGHQRQPDRRTVEGECLTALRSAKIVRDPRGAFFRSASRTDRGVSAVGNVIAFDTEFPPRGIVGAFNSRAADVWAWAYADVPPTFHPRHAIERWYRYILVDEVPIGPLRDAAGLFVGTHDFVSFSTDPGVAVRSIGRIEVQQVDGTTLIDVSAPSFRRGMVRRIVAGMLAVVRKEATAAEIEDALAGTKRDFGSVPPEPLILMDVRYGIPFRTVLQPGVVEAWLRRESAHRLGLRFLRDLREAVERSSNREAVLGPAS